MPRAAAAPNRLSSSFWSDTAHVKRGEACSAASAFDAANQSRRTKLRHGRAVWQAATEQPLGENRRGARARVCSGLRAVVVRAAQRRLVIGHQGALARTGTGGRDARETRRPAGRCYGTTSHVTRSGTAKARTVSTSSVRHRHRATPASSAVMPRCACPCCVRLRRYLAVKLRRSRPR